MNPAVAYISKSALQHNVRRIRALAPNAKILAMIKANAYGHGAFEIASELSSVDALGVSRINEALNIVSSGLNRDLILMEGCFSEDELQLAASHKFQVVIQNRQQLNQLLTTQLTQAVKVWLKINTGMNRLGINPDEAQDYYQQLTASDNCQSVTFLTHFACADEDNNLTNLQFERFSNSVADCVGERSCANSAGIIDHPQTHLDWVRPGIMLYGNSPIAGKTGAEHDLKPVMTLTSQVIAINQLHSGDGVGYGQVWQATKATQVAVVAIGYGDGYPRHAQEGTPVLINGVEYPLVGRVSMDMITVDIGDAEINIGDTVELWGTNLAAERVAEKSATISYELFCNLAERVDKVYLD